MRIAVLAAMLVFPAMAAGQSFDCARARTRAEQLVCGDKSLREFDESLGRYYSAARAELERGAGCLQADQARWLKATRDACPDAACLRTAYLNRLAELDPLQPGATALRMELPRVPSLVWVVAPAEDTVAAPANPKATPFEITGRLINEVSGGDGFVMQAADGTKVPLVLLMFLEGKTADRLPQLAKVPATFRAAGFAAADRGRRFFEPSRCTFLHRMPDDAEAPDTEQELEKVRTRVVTQGKVCPDPARPCPGFKPNELSFTIAQPFKFDRGRDRSQPFYAVILKSGPLCGIADEERVRAQKQFPGAKVFLHRYFCEEFGDKVTYSGVNEKSGFVAVYAGETDADGRRMLAQAKAAGFADANLRRLEVMVVYQLE